VKCFIIFKINSELIIDFRYLFIIIEIHIYSIQKMNKKSIIKYNKEKKKEKKEEFKYYYHHHHHIHHHHHHH
jgi:hypothetical protein